MLEGNKVCYTWCICTEQSCINLYVAAIRLSASASYRRLFIAVFLLFCIYGSPLLLSLFDFRLTVNFIYIIKVVLDCKLYIYKGKGKEHPITDHEGPEGEQMY